MSQDAGNNPNKINITSEDLSEASVVNRVKQFEEAQLVPLVQGVGVPTSSGSSSGKFILLGTLGGVLAGAFAWILSELTGVIFDEETVSTRVSNITFTLCLAAGIGIVIGLWDALQARSGQKAANAAMIILPSALGIGLVTGFIADAFYTGQIEGIFDRALAREQAGLIVNDAWYTSQLHLPRGLAWMLLGICAGIVAGIGAKSIKKGLNGLAGGLIGGFIGGFIFDSLPQVGSGVLSRAIGITLTGTLIGLGMSLVELVTRSFWIEIVSGGMAGKQFILYAQKISIGSGAQANVTLIKDPSIAPVHCYLERSGEKVTVTPANLGIPCIVNQQQIVTKTVLQDLATIQLGSTIIRFRAKSQDVPTVGPVRKN